jgi:hypothetical protein
MLISGKVVYICGYKRVGVHAIGEVQKSKGDKKQNPIV